jgi:hypothetical protein
MNFRAYLAATAAAATIVAAGPAAAQADNTNSVIAPATANTGTFPGAMDQYEATHEGRISRQAYMDEAGRRWDPADTDRRGLTSEQINRTYGGRQSDPVTGVITTPGYMGPKDAKK